MENNKNKKSVKFQGDMLNFCDFIQVFVFTPNHHLNINRTRSFPGADIGSDHDLVMMTFRVRLKKARKPNQPRVRFDLEKLRDPDVACTFPATIGGKFAPLIGLSDEDMDIDTIITTYWCPTSAPLPLSLYVLDLCDERRDLRRSGMKQKEQKNTGKQTGGFRRQ